MSQLHADYLKPHRVVCATICFFQGNSHLGVLRGVPHAFSSRCDGQWDGAAWCRRVVWAGQGCLGAPVLVHTMVLEYVYSGVRTRVHVYYCNSITYVLKLTINKLRFFVHGFFVASCSWWLLVFAKGRTKRG